MPSGGLPQKERTCLRTLRTVQNINVEKLALDNVMLRQKVESLDGLLRRYENYVEWLERTVKNLPSYRSFEERLDKK